MVNRHELIVAIDKMTAAIRRRVLLMIGRGVLLATNDSSDCQTVQIKGLKGEVLDGVERPTQYGFTSHAHPGADVVLVAVGGNRDHSLAICVGDRRYRLKGLAQGEVALHDDIDQVVHLKRNGVVVYSPQNVLMKADGVLRLEGDGVEIHADTYLQSDVHGKGQRETFTGGVNYDTETFTTISTGNSTESGLAQPSIPSGHPEGS